MSLAGLGVTSYPYETRGVGYLDLGAARGAPVTEAGREVKATVTGDRATGQGGSFRLRPRWPKADQLDYVQKFTTAALLSIGLLLLTAYAVRDPSGAFGMIVRGAKSRAGVG